MNIATAPRNHGPSFNFQAVTARNLDLLRAIEQTVERLTSDTDLLRSIERGYDELVEMLAKSQRAIDADGHLEDLLNQSMDQCSQMYGVATKAHRSDCADPRLRDEDGVADGYQAYIAVLRDVHDSIDRFLDALGTHDAALEPAVGDVHTNVDDLLAALESDR